MAQLALMRESLGAFSGNELVMGVVLGLWLLIMGLGSAMGPLAAARTECRPMFEWLLMLVAVLPPLQVFGLRALRNVVFLRGAAVGVVETVAAIFVLLLPYCLAAGCALTLGCFLLMREEGQRGTGRGYIADSVGGIAGGVLFSFLLVRWLDHIALLACPALLCLLAASVLGFRRKGWATPVLAAGLALVLLAFLAVAHPDALSTTLQFPGQRILERVRSPYGRLLVTESGGQFNFMENGVTLVSSRDVQRIEETVHYAMAQRPNAARVLLISGGFSGTANELLKYPVERIDYVELDPLLPDLGRKYLPGSLADSKIRIINDDGRLFIRQRPAASEKYDVVILDVPPPSTAQLNRFYTAEFFGEVKRALAAQGVISFAVGQYENYMGPNLARILATAQCSLGASFSNTLVIPGGRVFFLASDGPLSLEISASLEQHHIPTVLVNRHYLDAMLMPDRIAEITRALTPGAPLNTDFAPRLYFYHLRHWVSQFDLRFGPLQGGLVLLLGFYLVRLRGARFVLFASGFAGAALEVVLLLAFQMLCGSVYHQVGIIVTVFMLGLAVGARMFLSAPGIRGFRAVAVRSVEASSPIVQQGSGVGVVGTDAMGANSASLRSERTTLVVLSAAIAAYSAGLPLILHALDGLDAAWGSVLIVKGVVALLTFALAALAGGQFPLANRLERDTSAAGVSRLYTADFVGACLGALLASTLLIPLIGVSGLCLVCAALNLMAALSARPNLNSNAC
jgi:spermidine synthase